MLARRAVCNAVDVCWGAANRQRSNFAKSCIEKQQQQETISECKAQSFVQVFIACHHVLRCVLVVRARSVMSQACGLWIMCAHL